VYLAAIPVQVAIASSLASVGYVTRSSVGLAINLVLVGVGLLVMTNSLKAYGIRRRDRLVLYGGGIWIVALGAAVPHVAFLREWGYATFGAGHLLYAIASYAVLSGRVGTGTGGDHA